MSEVTDYFLNVAVLERLGWRIESWLAVDQPPVHTLIDPDGNTIAVDHSPHLKTAWSKAPDYVNDLNNAITLTVDGTYSEHTFLIYSGEWEARFAGIYDGRAYDKSLSRAICKAWLQAMSTLDRVQEGGEA